MEPLAQVSTTPRVILVVRQSPDWDALAIDHARGVEIDPARYLPPKTVQFPPSVDAAIARWNALYPVDFFTCRAVLRNIARANLAAVSESLVLGFADLPHALPSSGYRLFFLDDDDWFAPDTARRLAGVGDEDVAVFPLPRLDAPTFTFCRQPPGAGVAVGRSGRAPMRFMTNNYGLHPRMCATRDVLAFADHHAASKEADRQELTDAYHDVVVSATNKTPVSASVIQHILTDKEKFQRHVQAFVAGLERLALPPGAAWMREPVRLTVDLFAFVLGRAPTT